MGSNYSLTIRDEEIIDHGTEIPTRFSDLSTTLDEQDCSSICVDTWHLVKVYRSGIEEDPGIAQVEFLGYLTSDGIRSLESLSDPTEYMWKGRRENGGIQLTNRSPGPTTQALNLFTLQEVDGKVARYQSEIFLGQDRITDSEDRVIQVQILPIVEHNLNHIQTGTESENISECYNNCCQTYPDTCVNYAESLNEEDRREFLGSQCVINESSEPELGRLLDEVENPMCRMLVRLGDTSKIEMVCQEVYEVMNEFPSEFQQYLHENPTEWERLKDACACHMPESFYNELRESVRSDLDPAINRFLDTYGKSDRSRSCWLQDCRESSLNVQSCSESVLDVDTCWSDPENIEYIRDCTRDRVEKFCDQYTSDPACISMREPVMSGKKIKDGSSSLIYVGILMAIGLVIAYIVMRRRS